LGERPSATVGRLAPQGAAFAAALALVAGVYGRDAGAPGRVATELLAQARHACAAVSAPQTFDIPFTNLTWLCVPGRMPRLVGSLAGFLPPSSVVSAEAAEIAGDFRALHLRDARVLLEGPPALSVHVASLAVRGMPAWAQASILSPLARALLLSSTGFLTAWLAAHSVLRRSIRAVAAVLLVGAAGPVAALGVMRLLERMSAMPLAFFLVPPVAALCTLALGALMALTASRSRWRHLARRALALALRSKGATASH
jgi:hypothetical protein